MMPEPRATLDRELQRLQDEVLSLGSLVEETLLQAVDILKRQDLEAAQQLIARDRHINASRYAIEEGALATIALHQPMAGDLRVLAAVLDITQEIERIGDYAKGIARIALLIGHEPLLKPLIDVPLMAQKARAMLHEALIAFIERDVEAAYAIPKQDDEVDALYNQVYRELISYILQDVRHIEQANYLLWAAHNLERAADRVSNICERVIFTATGELVELDLK